ncbi:MAG TPA: dihydroorotase [Acidimicrobiales bacterium]|nr:dihydroorotase [Acidimicrobiales bacterium]
MSTLLLRHATLVHEQSTQVGDVLVREGRIEQVGAQLERPAGAREIDCTGCWVGPGFVDLHTHLREPGREEAETIESGARVAAVGGYTAVVAMANTEPALDNVALVSYVLDRGARTPIDVAVCGAITQGRRGELLAPMAEMAELGVRLFSDDGTGVQDPMLMLRALTYVKPLGVRLAQHCEDELLAAGGSMNEGLLSSRRGLGGRSSLSEEIMVMRDIELVRHSGGALHFLHLSTARSLALVIQARCEGLDVTCEVAPHHFTLDESACEGFDPIFKVHPPLRTKNDVTELRRGLVEGTVDAVATDHAPHAPQLKDLAFDEAPAGMLGLEHAASLTFEALGGDACDPVRFFQLLSRGPARVARLRAADHRLRHSAHGAVLAAGEDANLVVFDPASRWSASRDDLHGRSTNTPYDGRAMMGRVRATIAKGNLVVDQGEPL